jgi:hypothetical protein
LHDRAVVAISGVAIVIRDGKFQLQHFCYAYVANTLVTVRAIVVANTLATVQLSSQIVMAIPPFAIEALSLSSRHQKSFAIRPGKWAGLTGCRLVLTGYGVNGFNQL